MTTHLTKTKILLAGLLLTVSTIFNACTEDSNVAPLAAAKPDLVFVALTSEGKLETYNANNLGVVLQSVTVTGLQPGEVLQAIDFRPATGQLYGLGSNTMIYSISSTGKATAIGMGAFSPILTGRSIAFDFNPVVDRIRIVTSARQNLRLNPETGALQMADGDINGVAGATISSVAYENSVAGAATTDLYDLDVLAGKLYRQDPPNAGTLVEVGPLGVTGDGESAFDISFDGIGLAAIRNGGTSSLYQVNIDNGSTINLGAFASTIIGLAIATQPVAYAVDAANNLIIFNPTKAGTEVTKLITGLQAGESIFGIDFRPKNGQLYALGSTSRLYTINVSSGAAAQVGTMPISPMLSGTSFGFDFNPTVDKIRITSNTGQNLRVDPVTGVVVIDGNLNPGTPSVSASAYTNSFAGATTTTLYGIDFSNDKLFRQVPPNDGTLVEVGALGINIEAGNGFDIFGSATVNTAYGVFTVGAATKVYTIDLTTGAATAGVDFSKPVKGFALGLGF